MAWLELYIRFWLLVETEEVYLWKGNLGMKRIAGITTPDNHIPIRVLEEITGKNIIPVWAFTRHSAKQKIDSEVYNHFLSQAYLFAQLI